MSGNSALNSLYVEGVTMGGRHFSSACATNGTVYVFGGRVPDWNPSYRNDLWRFTNGTWTQLSGFGSANALSVIGNYTPVNFPSARYGSMTWVYNNTLFLFGGYGYGTEPGRIGYMNDLWRYSLSAGQWTWLPGGCVTAPECYGSNGVVKWPGGRRWATIILSGSSVWMYGGDGIATVDRSQGSLSELWKYDHTSSSWLAMNSLRSANQLPTYYPLGVGSSNASPGGRYGMAGVQLSDGKLWFFGGKGYCDSCWYGDLWSYWPSNGEWTRVFGGNVSSVNDIPQPLFGELHQSDLFTEPGARMNFAMWTLNNTISMFGGVGNYGTKNDIWTWNTNVTATGHVPSGVSITDLVPGLQFEVWLKDYFPGDPDFSAKMTNVTIDYSWESYLVLPNQRQAQNQFGLRWAGYINPPKTGYYYVISTTDDGSKLAINNTLYLDNNAVHATENHGCYVYLEANQITPFEYYYFDYFGRATVQLQWQMPNTSYWSNIPSSVFYYKPEVSNTTSVCTTTPFNQLFNLTCPNPSQLITQVTFATLGNSTGGCGNLSYGLCHALYSQQLVEGKCLGLQSCSFMVDSSVWSASECVGNSNISLTATVTCSTDVPTNGKFYSYVRTPSEYSTYFDCTMYGDDFVIAQASYSTYGSQGLLSINSAAVGLNKYKYTPHGNPPWTSEPRATVTCAKTVPDYSNVLVPCPSVLSPGPSGAVLNIRGGSISFAYPYKLPAGTAARTISFWFMMDFDTPLDDYIILSRGDSGSCSSSNQFGIGIEASTLMIAMKDCSGAVIARGPVVSLGTWHHIAVVYQANTVTFYVDGVASSTSLAQNTNKLALQIGTQVYTNGGQMFGYLDELRIWNIAFNSSLVQQDMNSKTPVSPNNLVGYWDGTLTSNMQLKDLSNWNYTNSDGTFSQYAYIGQCFTSEPNGEAALTSKSNHTDNTTVSAGVVGSVGGILVLVLLGAIAAFVFLGRRKNHGTMHVELPSNNNA